MTCTRFGPWLLEKRFATTLDNEDDGVAEGVDGGGPKGSGGLNIISNSIYFQE